MIKFNNKKHQDFLNKKMVFLLLENKVPMEDAKYFVLKIKGTEYIVPKEDINLYTHKYEIEDKYPTYTLSELMYKLPEWHSQYKGLIGFWKRIKKKKLIFWKDAPFYFMQYEGAPENGPFCVYNEYPIYSAAYLLINCMKEGLGCVRDISEK